MFPDACPGTSKYLEVHYACVNNVAPDGNSAATAQRKIPPWMRKQNDLKKETKKKSRKRPTDVGAATAVETPESASTTSTTPRKPILVTDKTEKQEDEAVVTEVVDVQDEEETSLNSQRETDQRVPITTPRSVNDVQQQKTTTYTPPSTRRTFSTQSSLGPICPPTTSRQLQWDRTPRGKEAVQPCPIGATGHAKWSCRDDGRWATPTPDMSHCKSVAMANLESQVRKQDPENVLVSALAYLTRTKSLYGGDLETAVSTMRTVASRIQYRLQQSARYCIVFWCSYPLLTG
jgi:hypothetical protein